MIQRVKETQIVISIFKGLDMDLSATTEITETGGPNDNHVRCVES